MRSGLALFWMVTCATAAGGDSAPKSPAPNGTPGVSVKLSREIRAGLPTYRALEKPMAPPLFSEPHDGDVLQQVLQLAKVEVRANKSVPDSSAFVSEAGFALFLRRRYPGASLKGQDPYHSHLPNYAALQYREDERLRRLREFKASTRATPRDDGMNDLLDDTFLRRPTGQDEAMDKSYNQNRR